MTGGSWPNKATRRMKLTLTDLGSGCGRRARRRRTQRAWFGCGEVRVTADIQEEMPQAAGFTSPVSQGQVQAVSEEGCHCRPGPGGSDSPWPP